MRKSLIIPVSLFLIVGTAILWFWRIPVAPMVGVSFRGFTNDSKGVRFATFCISNLSSGSVIRWGHFAVETRQTPWPRAMQQSFAPTAELSPGQSESVSLPAPTNTAAWKAVLFFSREKWRSRAIANTNSLLMRITGQHGVSIPTEVWKSEWFAQ